MDAIDGSGDGECGNGMDWIGSPVTGGCDVVAPEAAVAAPRDGDADAADVGVGRISEMTGPVDGMPP